MPPGPQHLFSEREKLGRLMSAVLSNGRKPPTTVRTKIYDYYYEEKNFLYLSNELQDSDDCYLTSSEVNLWIRTQRLTLKWKLLISKNKLITPSTYLSFLDTTLEMCYGEK